MATEEKKSIPELRATLEIIPEDERSEQCEHQIRIGMITAVYRDPGPGSPAGLSTPGDSSSQSSTFICSASSTWRTSIR